MPPFPRARCPHCLKPTAINRDGRFRAHGRLPYDGCAGSTTYPRPLLFLDVDGPLNPHYMGKKKARRLGYQRDWINGFDVALNPTHGPALLDLPVDLVWGTTWTHDANTMIGPRIGLPELPVCEWPTHKPRGLDPDVYFKTPELVDYAEDRHRAWVWVDDEIGDADREYVAGTATLPNLLHKIDPREGLTEADFDAIRVWASSLNS